MQFQQAPPRTRLRNLVVSDGLPRRLLRPTIGGNLGATLPIRAHHEYNATEAWFPRTFGFFSDFDVIAISEQCNCHALRVASNPSLSADLMARATQLLVARAFAFLSDPQNPSFVASFVAFCGGRAL
jgi:hypothetical protein